MLRLALQRHAALPALLALAAFAATATAGASEQTKHPRLHTNAIYDGDHRVDIYEVTDPKILTNADATVSVFDRSSLTPAGDGFDISLAPMKKSMNICNDERFAEQPTAADCSGALVAPNRIFTAGHCISKATCAQTSFVFGYRMTSANQTATHFPRGNVFSCKRILARVNTDSVDFAVVELDRPVVTRAPVTLATDDVDDGDEVYLLSHPAGTPLKFSSPVKVTNSTKNHFIAPIDALGGSSGGPVFSQARNELVGILVSGEDDYVQDAKNSCKRVNNIKHCGQGNDCDGEQSTHVSVVTDALTEAD